VDEFLPLEHRQLQQVGSELAGCSETLQVGAKAGVGADPAVDFHDLLAADLTEANLPPVAEKVLLLCNHSQIMGEDHQNKDLLEVEEYHVCEHSSQNSLA
jgi:hypothetical protein